MSFNLHIQSVAHLIRATKEKTGLSLTRFAAYIIWNHASKLVQRIISADLPEQYKELFGAVGNDKAAFTGSQAAKTLNLMIDSDKDLLDYEMQRWSNLDMEKFGRLRAFFNGKEDGKSDQQSILHAFHLFFVEVLNRARYHFEELRKLATRNTAPEEQEIASVIIHCFRDLSFLEHFAWRSKFFQVYIEEYLCAAFETVLKAPGPSKKEIKKADDEQPFQGDIASEYVEVVMEGNLGPGMASQVLAWLRLISATLHYTQVLWSGNTVIRQYAMKNIEFQVVEYPDSSMELQPWREVIKSLYSDDEETARSTIEELVERYRLGGSHNQNNAANLVLARQWRFSGRPHCEAMLTVAHFLSRHGKDGFLSVSVHVFVQPVLASHVRFQY
jgi:hypothetical protein